MFPLSAAWLSFDVDGDGGGAAGAPAGDAAAPGAGDTGAAPAGGEAGAVAGAEGAAAGTEQGAAPAGSPEDPAPAPGALDTDAPQWNGQIDALKELPGWTALDPGAQRAIEAKLKDLQLGWQRSYTEKFTGIKADRDKLAADRAQLEADRQAVVQLQEAWLATVTGEDNPLEARDAEIERLKTELEAAKKAPGAGADPEAWAQERQALTAQHEQAVQALQAERDAALGERTTILGQIQAAYNDHLAEWLATNAPDLSDEKNDAALQAWVQLHAAGNDLETALKMVRVRFPAPVEVEVPPELDVMSVDGRSDGFRRAPGGGSGGQSVLDRLRQETTANANWLPTPH